MDQVFKENPNLKEYFKTSDGTPFYSQNAAQNHAKKLEDKTITPVVRPAGKVIDLGAEKPFKKMTKEELTAKAILLGIEVKDENEADLIILIEDALKSGDEGTGSNSGDEKKEKALKNMNKAELMEKATALEIEVPEDTKNADIVKLIEVKLEEIAAASASDNDNK